MTNIEQHIATVRDRIQQTCRKAGRPVDAVALLAVSKSVSPEAIRTAIAAGLCGFGENYIAEGVEKMVTLAEETRQYGLQWHCIGPVQSNKTRLVAQHFDWVHTIDRSKIAERLNEQRPENCKPLQVCIQVNIDASHTKSGVAPDELFELADTVTQLPRLQLRGIMVMPDVIVANEAATNKNATNNIANKDAYTAANALFLQLKTRYTGIDTLSIGMSADLELAIGAGSTLVRIGSAIFGGRLP
jgi:PLP dependent protein